MRKVILMALLAVMSSGAWSKQPPGEKSILLSCVGSMPYYENGWILNHPMSDTDRNEMTVNLNLKALLITLTLPYIGRIESSLLATPEFYSSSYFVRTQVLGVFIEKVNISINRITGSAFISYDKPDGAGWIAFNGTCKPAMAKF